MRRRQLMAAMAAALPWGVAAREGASLHAAAGPEAKRPPPPEVRPGRPLVWPRDFGAHPAYRTEWWYITGTLAAPATDTAPGSAGPAGDAASPAYGFQLTFFRSRVDAAAGSTSRFAAQQLIFAHAAVTDLKGQRLLHDQRIARAGFGIAEASEADTDLKLRDWTLARQGPPERSVYRARLPSREFALDLRIGQTQPLILQGDAGYSRKGPQPAQASYYYSKPHLAVQGQLMLGGTARRMQGSAWLDHEWSEALLDADATGWDWIGINLLDGGALTAFRLRRADGSSLWAGGSLRRAGGEAQSFAAEDVRFTPEREWTSPATAARYPVEWRVDTPAGRHRVRALLDAQELDSRASTGAVYWEGLSELLDASGRRIGLGYLEMTGYSGRLRL